MMKKEGPSKKRCARCLRVCGNCCYKVRFNCDFLIKIAQIIKSILFSPILRIVLGFIALLGDIIIFFEDPQSYSNYNTDIPIIGITYNFMTSGYPNNELNPRWLALKISLIVTFFLLSFPISVFFRKLILSKLLRIEIFKRRGCCKIFTLIFIFLSFWISALTYTFFVRNWSNHKLKFLWTESPFYEYYDENLLCGDNSLKKSMDSSENALDILKSSPSNYLPITNSSFSLLSMFLSLFTTAIGLFCMIDFILQDRDYVKSKSDNTYHKRYSMWSKIRIPTFWVFLGLLIFSILCGSIAIMYKGGGFLYWQGEYENKSYNWTGEYIQKLYDNYNYFYKKDDISTIQTNCDRFIRTNSKMNMGNWYCYKELVRSRSCENINNPTNELKKGTIWFVDYIHDFGSKNHFNSTHINHSPFESILENINYNNLHRLCSEKTKYNQADHNNLYLYFGSVKDIVLNRLSSGGDITPDLQYFLDWMDRNNNDDMLYSREVILPLKYNDKMRESKYSINVKDITSRGNFNLSEHGRIIMVSLIIVLNMLLIWLDPDYPTFKNSKGNPYNDELVIPDDDYFNEKIIFIPGFNTDTIDFPDFSLLPNFCFCNEVEKKFCWFFCCCCHNSRKKKIKKSIITTRFITNFCIMITILIWLANLYSIVTYDPESYGHIIDDDSYIHPLKYETGNYFDSNKDQNIGKMKEKYIINDNFRYSNLETMCPLKKNSKTDMLLYRRSFSAARLTDKIFNANKKSIITRRKTHTNLKELDGGAILNLKHNFKSKPKHFSDIDSNINLDMLEKLEGFFFRINLDSVKYYDERGYKIDEVEGVDLHDTNFYLIIESENCECNGIHTLTSDHLENNFKSDKFNSELLNNDMIEIASEDKNTIESCVIDDNIQDVYYDTILENRELGECLFHTNHIIKITKEDLIFIHDIQSYLNDGNHKQSSELHFSFKNINNILNNTIWLMSDFKIENIDSKLQNVDVRCMRCEFLRNMKIKYSNDYFQDFLKKKINTFHNPNTLVLKKNNLSKLIIYFSNDCDNSYQNKSKTNKTNSTVDDDGIEDKEVLLLTEARECVDTVGKLNMRFVGSSFLFKLILCIPALLTVIVILSIMLINDVYRSLKKWYLSYVSEENYKDTCDKKKKCCNPFRLKLYMCCVKIMKKKNYQVI